MRPSLEEKDAYRLNGVREYVVWRTEDQALDWWELLEGIGPREMMVGDHSGLNRYYF